MLAIIETGGKQYLVKKATAYKLKNSRATLIQPSISIKSLFTSDGKRIPSRKALFRQRKVEGKVLKQGRGKKIHVLKYKAKSKYRRKQGHRQHFTEVEIIKV